MNAILIKTYSMSVKFIFGLLLSQIVFTTAIKGQINKREMARYNIAFGAISGDIGAMINKDPNEKWHKAFLKGAGYGMIGGYLIYESKNVLGRVSKKKKWQYSWYAKGINSVGISMIENAAHNRLFMEVYHINLGFNRFEVYTRNKFHVKYKVMPVSLLLTTSLALKNKFELRRSFEIGEFVFSSSKTKGNNRGTAYGNILLIKNGFFDEYDLYSHEITHIYQYRDYNFFNSYMSGLKDKLINERMKENKLIDHIYFDANGLALWPLYFGQESIFGVNWFEDEANFWEH
ncbi:MAG: hypothetical protein AB8H03_28685 [Saprospiraceae bacterium]